MQRTPMTQRRSTMNSSGLSPVFEVGGALLGAYAAWTYMWRAAGQDDEYPDVSLEELTETSGFEKAGLLAGALAGYKVGVMLA